MNKIRKICFVTDPKSWLIPHVKDLVKKINNDFPFESKQVTNHKNVPEDTDFVFLLSYFSIVENFFLERYSHVLVVHESDLPSGKGWAPLFWQVIEGKNKIPVVLFEATKSLDRGPVYLRDTINLEGHELHDELREKQAQVTFDLCIRFLNKYPDVKPEPQEGKESFYPKRDPSDSELDPGKTIVEQFDLLRTVNNEDYPAFFYLRGHKYILKIFKDD